MLTTPQILIDRTKESILSEYKDVFDIIEKEIPKNLKVSILNNINYFTITLPCAIMSSDLYIIRYMYKQSGWKHIDIGNIFIKGSRNEDLKRTRITFYM